MGTFSGYIHRLTRVLLVSGVRVHFEAYPHADVGGAYRESERRIWVDTSVAKEALFTLAHEGGHWAGYRLHAKRWSEQRERQAFVYGWRLLQIVGAEAVVARQEWNANERAAGNVGMLRHFRTAQK